MQTTESVGDTWIAQDQLTGASSCFNSLVILTAGEQKMAGCLQYCLGAIVFPGPPPPKKITAFEEWILTHIYNGFVSLRPT